MIRCILNIVRNSLLIKCTLLSLFLLTVQISSAPIVQSGLDILTSNNCSVLKGKRVALLTNRTAINGLSEHLLDICKKNSINIVKVFTPEHGFSVDKDSKVSGGKLGSIPLISLYGKRLIMKPEDLHDIDILVFDIQSVGARYYTYIATMVYSMKACTKARKEFLILDRPNPSGGSIVSGFIPEKGLTNRFASIYPIPIRHGMTMGELATMFNTQYAIHCKLSVIKMKNWKREMIFSDTGLPWMNPSPNIKREEGAILYCGLGWLETTNLSMARNTDYPFEMLGAPYIDSVALVKNIGTINGAYIKPVSFIPKAEPHKHYNKRCNGVQIILKDKHTFDGFSLGLKIYQALNELYPKEYLSFSGLKTSSGRRDLKKIVKSKSVTTIVANNRYDLKSFIKQRSKFLLY